MVISLPTKVIMLKGKAMIEKKEDDLDHVRAYESALYNAGADHLNLVPVSSVVPKGAHISWNKHDALVIPSGSVVPCVESYTQLDGFLDHTIEAVAIGAAIPDKDDPHAHGFFVECHFYEMTFREAKKKAEELARELYFAKFKEEPYITFSIAEVADIPDKNYISSAIVLALLV